MFFVLFWIFTEIRAYIDIYREKNKINPMESPSKQQKIDNNSSQIPLMIWLDSFADASDENRNAQELLRAVDPNLKLFKLPNECEDFIKSNSGTNQIVLIVSGGLGQTFVPLIRTEKQVVSIYVYCGNEQHHKKWAKNYPEVNHR